MVPLMKIITAFVSCTFGSEMEVAASGGRVIGGSQGLGSFD